MVLLFLPALAAALTWSQVFMPGTVLPLFGNHPLVQQNLGDQTLPPPFGLTLGHFAQKQHFDVTRLHFQPTSMAGEGATTAQPPGAVSLASFANAASGGVSRLRQWGPRLDAWLLPVLNVFYMPGQGSGSALIDGEYAGAEEPSYLYFAYALRSETLGGTLAMGSGSWWCSLSQAWTASHGEAPDELNFRIDSRVLGARAGYQPVEQWGVWVGAAHLHLQPLSGELRGLSWTSGIQPASRLPLLDEVIGTGSTARSGEAVKLDFIADVRPRGHWTYLLGLVRTLTPHLSLQIEAGYDPVGNWLSVIEIQGRMP